MFIAWENLVCGYGSERPLNAPFTGRIDAPGIYAVLGPNGSGKSTLLRTWLGLQAPLSGSVTHSGLRGSRDGTEAKRIGYVPQFHKVNPFVKISILDLVKQGAGTGNEAKPETNLLAEKLLSAFDLMTSCKRPFHELSMGQKTRSLVVRALMARPHLLFLDEPLASLDTHCQSFLINHLRALANTDGLCAIMIDHHLDHFRRVLSGRFDFERQHNQDVCHITFHALDATTELLTERCDQCPQ